MKACGYNGRLLFVDLSDGSTEVVEPEEDWYRIYAGGGLVGAYLLLTRTAPGSRGLPRPQ